MLSETKHSLHRFAKLGLAATENKAFIAEEDQPSIFESLSLAEQLFPDAVLMLCPRNHPQYSYTSINSKMILGIEHTAFRHWKPEDFIAHVHPDDRSDVKACLHSMTISDMKDPSEVKFALHYRMRSANGAYAYILDEKLAVKTIKGKYVFFTIFRNISATEKFYGVRLDVFSKANQVFRKTRVFKPAHTEQRMTIREREVASLVVKGFSNQEMAEYLNISLYTVKNHKQRLFRKTKSKNSLELASLMGAF